MCSDVAIRVESVGKCFHIYEKPHHRLLQMLSRGRARYYREFWALQNASFEVMRGEAVGIVGRNGSGKSTLLQMICGTLTPTTGSIRTKGRVAALLELGSGFNPEFTGRENVYLNGAVLGLSREEIDARYGRIVEFADIGDFIDQPVRTYSSGMLVRLAFSVAINVDPDILVVDEALAVGDELFQRKCFSRIEEIRSTGATVLFVSHSGAHVTGLCDRAILLDAGEKLAEGHPKGIVGGYQKLLYAPTEKRGAIRDDIRAGRLPSVAQDAADGGQAEPAGDARYDPNLRSISVLEYERNGVRVHDAGICDVTGARINNLVRGERYFFRYRVAVDRHAQAVRFGMLIKTTSGIELGGAVSSPAHRRSAADVEAGDSYDVEFGFRCSLNPGVYFFNAGVVGDLGEGETYLHRIVDIEMFRVRDVPGDVRTGTIDFDCVSDVRRR